MIRDQIIFSNRTDFLQTKCFNCSSKTHMISQCPLIHYVPNILKIVKKHEKDPGQSTRTFCERSRTKDHKWNSLYFLSYIQNSSIKFREFLNNYDSDDNSDPEPEN